MIQPPMTLAIDCLVNTRCDCVTLKCLQSLKQMMKTLEIMMEFICLIEWMELALAEMDWIVMKGLVILI